MNLFAKNKIYEIPIFIISFNRAKFLNKVVESYLNFKKSVRIIIHDNGSDDEETINVLNCLERNGVIVYRNGKIFSKGELESVNRSIERYFKDYAPISRYVVTDCDIDLSIADKNVLDVYDDLLNQYPSAECVGPMLRIIDVPKTYPLYRSLISKHVNQFWHQHPEWCEINGHKIATQDAAIDSTFALHRAGEIFRRLKRGRRVYYPYEAQHLDWYLEPEEFFTTKYSRSNSGNLAHWNNRLLVEEDYLHRPMYSEYFHVVKKNGILVEEVQKI